jgi:hypothetical protein
MGRLEQRMDRVEEGVANFRDFQLTARDFFTRSTTLEKEREEQQQNRHRENQEKIQQVSNQIGRKTLWWTAAGVSLTLAGIVIAILGIWVMIRLSKSTNLNEFLRSQANLPVVSYSQPPQDASRF